METQKTPYFLKQLMLLIGLIIGGFLLTLILSAVSLMPFLGVKGFNEVVSNPTEHVGLLKYLQILQSICLFVVPAFFFTKIIGKIFQHYFKLHVRIGGKTVVITIITVIVAIPFINLLGFINEQMVLPEWLSGVENWMKSAELRAAEMTHLLVSGETVGDLLLNLVMIAVLPAIGEELIFRGALQNVLTKITRNTRLAIWISAFIFSAFHLQFYGFLPRLFLGAVLGYLFVYSGSLWLPILAHFINNAAATIFYFLYNKQHLTNDMDTIGTAESLPIGLASAAVLLIIFFFTKQHYKTHWWS